MPTLPVHRCSFVDGQGCEAVERLVPCPKEGHAVTVEKCADCAHLESFWDSGSEGAVHCSPAEAPRRNTREDFRERAARALVQDFASAETVCVQTDTSLERATQLLAEHNVGCLLVVDPDKRLVGILSRTDVLREQARGEGSASTPVESVMTPQVHALPEDAPLSYAIGLMAAQGVHQVPLVTPDGRVVGAVEALDALRWTAEELGYRLVDASAPKGA